MYLIKMAAQTLLILFKSKNLFIDSHNKQNIKMKIMIISQI